MNNFDAMIERHLKRLENMDSPGPQMTGKPIRDEALQLEVARRGSSQYARTQHGTIVRKNLPDLTPS